VIPSIQKNLDVWAAPAGCFLESALAPVLEPVQCRLDMLAGAQTVNTVVGAVAAVDLFGKRANLDAINLSAAGVGPIATKKIINLRLGFDPDFFIDAAQTTTFDFIGVTGEPT